MVENVGIDEIEPKGRPLLNAVDAEPYVMEDGSRSLKSSRGSWRSGPVQELDAISLQEAYG